MKLTERDITYIRANYHTLDELCANRPAEPAEIRSLVERGVLPRPSYVLPDGAEMFPEDYLVLLDEAGGPDQVKERFAERYVDAATAEGVKPALDEEWDGYLSGQYGVCLKRVTPETIVRKEALVVSIGRLLATPLPNDPDWRDELHRQVDELDELEREFSPDHDRVAFGKPPTRDSHIAAPRARYPDVFAALR
jgi:Family of unknown function (DUF6058)